MLDAPALFLFLAHTAMQLKELATIIARIAAVAWDVGQTR